MFQTLNNDSVNLVTTYLSNQDIYLLKCTSKIMATLLNECSYFKVVDIKKGNARRRYLIHKETYFDRVSRLPNQGLYNLFLTTIGRQYLNRICTSAIIRTLRRTRRSAMRNIAEHELQWYTQFGFFAWVQECASRKARSSSALTIRPSDNEMLCYLFEKRKKHLIGPYKNRAKTLLLSSF